MAAPPALPSTCSGRALEPWNDSERSLAPAGAEQFQRQLTACLALCSPSGMSEDDRREWLRAAWGALHGIPADLLKRGCAEARRRADHPAKIVPIIMAEVEDAWRRRKAGDVRSEPAPAPAEDFVRCTPEEAAAIRAEFGIGPPERGEARPVGDLRMPSVADYVGMGLSREAAEAEVEKRGEAHRIRTDGKRIGVLIDDAIARAA